MKKFFIILLAAIAVFIVAYFSVGEVNYNIDMFIIHTLDRGDGVYCTPHRCADMIHEYVDLMHKSEIYAKEYGANDPGRPCAKYKYDSYLNAYVRWFK